jgi:integrase
VKYRRGVWSVLQTHVLPRLGELTVDEVQRKHVKAMKQAMLTDKKKKSNRTVQKALRVTSKLFNWAIDDEELIDRDNPAARPRAPQSASSQEYYTTDEVARLLTWAANNDPSLHPMVAFAFYTGCRKGEIAALKWSEIDWQGARVRIHESWDDNARKSGEPVSPNLHPHLVAILEAWQQQTGGEGEALVFPDPMTGEMRPEYNNRAVFKKTGKKTGLWGLDDAIVGAEVRALKKPWHSFRHSAGTLLAAAGAPEAAVQTALGQSTPAAARGYIHTAAADVKKYVEKMPTIGPVVSLDAARTAKATNRQPSENGADKPNKKVVVSSRK